MRTGERIVLFATGQWSKNTAEGTDGGEPAAIRVDEKSLVGAAQLSVAIQCFQSILRTPPRTQKFTKHCQGIEKLRVLIPRWMCARTGFKQGTAVPTTHPSAPRYSNCKFILVNL